MERCEFGLVPVRMVQKRAVGCSRCSRFLLKTWATSQTNQVQCTVFRHSVFQGVPNTSESICVTRLTNWTVGSTTFKRLTQGDHRTAPPRAATKAPQRVQHSGSNAGTHQQGPCPPLLHLYTEHSFSAHEAKGVGHLGGGSLGYARHGCGWTLRGAALCRAPSRRRCGGRDGPPG